MVVLLVIGIGFVQNYTSIPFEKLWELTPQSGIATEPGYEGGGGGTSVSDNLAKHFFTTGSSNDLSEIACFIGTDIYNDYSNNGEQGGRSGLFVTNIPFDRGNLINSASFFYKDNTNTSVNDAIFGATGAKYQGCHICRQCCAEGTGCTASQAESTCGPSSGPWPKGIQVLDELCINMQMRDRTVPASSGSYFCHGQTNDVSIPYGASGYCSPSPCNGQFLTLSTSSNAQMGNNNAGAQRAQNQGLAGWYSHSNGGDSDPLDYCDNGKDNIRWSADVYDSSNDHWKDSSGNPYKWLVKDDSNIDKNANVLSNGWKYTYGVWWGSDGKYWLTFNLFPDENAPYSSSQPIATDFSDLWTKIFWSKGWPGSFFRVNALGYKYWELRSSAIYYVQPTASTNLYQTVVTEIEKAAGSNQNNVVCGTCKSDDCLPLLPKFLQSKDCNFDLGGMPIYMYTNFTDSNGNHWTDCQHDLLSGYRYKVIVKNWMSTDSSGCTYAYDRTVTILQLTGGTCAGLGGCIPSGPGCQLNGGHDMGRLDCPAGQICCA
jgi:hypothetical protein